MNVFSSIFQERSQTSNLQIQPYSWIYVSVPFLGPGKLYFAFDSEYLFLFLFFIGWQLF